MTIQILMPALSPTMTEGKLTAWMKAEGDVVEPGDVIAEIETDKATMEVEAVEEGTLGKILIEAGTEGVPVNTAIAVLLEEGESAADISAEAGMPEPSSAPAGAPDPSPLTKAPSFSAAATPGSSASGGRIIASPLARRMAEQAGIDLNLVAGSGPNGRIVKKDIEAGISSGAGRSRAVPGQAPIVTDSGAVQAPAADVPGVPEFEEITNTTMRKVIARRLTESKQFAPHFYLTVDCEIDALLAIRKQLNEKLADTKISVNDMVVKVAALALKQVPAANASWTEDAVRVYRSVDVSVAVAIEGGLITPVVRGAQNKGLSEIAAEIKDLATRARDGKLSPEEYQGGTFSISNLGMFGIKEFAAVINPPQGAILAIGAGEERPVVNDGTLAIATVMSCTLSADHRVVDGAIGAEFMAAFKNLIENPLTMLL